MSSYEPTLQRSVLPTDDAGPKKSMDRSVSPAELLKAALSHITPEEHTRIAEEAKQIVERANRYYLAS